MAELARGKTVVRLPDKRRRRRRVERVAVAKVAKAEEARSVNAKAAQELKANATRPARQCSEGAARRN